MHSPEVLIFDLRVPWPTVRWRRLAQQPSLWQFQRRRYTCPEEENQLCGKPMHSLLRPAGWQLILGRREIGWTNVADVWHIEPDDQDSGTVCKGMGGSDLTWSNVKWAWKHREHVSVHFTHYRKAHRWLYLRCDHCGKPFRGKYRGVVGTWGGDEHWHVHCEQILARGRTNEVLADYIINGTDEWIARRWAEGIVERKAEKV